MLPHPFFRTVITLACVVLVLCVVAGHTHVAAQNNDLLLRQRARELARTILIADTHIDVPYRLDKKPEDVGLRATEGDFDYPRAREGGLDAAFMSIYVPASYESKGAKSFADRMIAIVNDIVAKHPDKFAIATSVADVRAQFTKGLVSLPMGMENGAPLEGSLENLAYFYNKGIRYITLTHSKSNHISDSSFDTERQWNGLSPFGAKVVAEMNRLGIMVDISHVSDSAFYQVLRITKAPVIASHSSCRAFTPGFERNMSDDMIKALAANGGVIHINFGSGFLDSTYLNRWMRSQDVLNKYFEEHNLKANDPAAVAYAERYRKENPVGYADVKDVVAHIDHVVRLVGVDHVGLGSDFDGVGDSLPTGLKDVSYFPNLIYELLKRGYAEADIKKICGENTLRVWSNVEAIARKLQAGQ